MRTTMRTTMRTHTHHHAYHHAYSLEYGSARAHAQVNGSTLLELARQGRLAEVGVTKPKEQSRLARRLRSVELRGPGGGSGKDKAEKGKKAYDDLNPAGQAAEEEEEGKSSGFFSFLFRNRDKPK